MRTHFIFSFLIAACTNLPAAPVNDNFASRISLAGSVVTTDGTNVAATVETGENTQNNLFGATVWWSWQAPASGWVRIDTADSTFDTVLQISTGGTVAAQTEIGFNDQAPGGTLIDASSVSFMAAAGTVYNIAVGGWKFVATDMGTISLHIITGSEAAPPFFPATLTFSPPSVDITNTAANVTAAFSIQAFEGSGTGIAGIGFGWEDRAGDGPFTGEPGTWDTSLPQSGSPQVPFRVPRYKAPGDQIVWFKIIPDGGGPVLIFSSPDGGSGYALPPAPAVAQSFPIINSGLVDEGAPHLTAFSVTPNSANVTTEPATLQVTAAVLDSPAGLESVKVLLKSTASVHDLVANLTLKSGTIQDGEWTGEVAIPRLYPTDNYSVLIECTDVAENRSRYGESGSLQIPGGDLDVPVIGGSAYEKWAWTNWFFPGDAHPGPLNDADGDGSPNLISYAFDLNPFAPTYSPGALPLVELTDDGGSSHLRITYLRRKSSTNSGLTYSPQFTSSPSGVWQTVSGGMVTSLDSTWELVAVDDTVDVSTGSRRFGRVRVVYVAP